MRALKIVEAPTVLQFKGLTTDVSGARRATARNAEAFQASIADAHLTASAIGRHVLETSSDLIVLIDEEFVVEVINAAGLRMLDLPAGTAVLGQPLNEVWPAGMRAALSPALAQARDSCATRFIAVDRASERLQRRWEISASRVDTPGAERRLIVTARDLSESDRLEAALALSEQRFRALADNMAQFAWMGDATGAIFWYNKRWFEYTGTTLAEMAGWGWVKVHHPEHVERVTAGIKASFGAGTAWEDTFPLRGADGSYRWFLSRAVPVRDAAGKVALWCGTNTDITDQRTATARLRRKARLIELSHEAIIVWDFETGIQTWNRGCEELYGYSRAEALGASPHALLKTEHPHPAADFERQLRRSGSWTGELRHVGADGSAVWVDSRQEVIRVGGRDVVLETNRDVTERRRADEVRRLLMTELDHRVKNMLAIIQSIASQTGRHCGDKDEFLSAFTSRLQALASAHTVLSEAHWQGAMLHELLGAVTMLPDGTGGRYEIAGEDVALPSQLALHLVLVLHELVSNAQRHGSLAGAAGHVRIRTERVPGEPDQLRMTWVESGGPAVVAPRHKGFGLTLIERSQSLPHLKIALAFRPDGLECTFTAPLREMSKEQLIFNPRNLSFMSARMPDTGLASARGTRSLRVLVAEAETVLAMEVEDALWEAGLVPIGPLATEAAAVEVLSSTHVDAAVVDARLPRGAGDTPRLLELLEEKKIPVVLIGSSTAGTAHGLTRATVLARPVEPSAVADAVLAATARLREGQCD